MTYSSESTRSLLENDGNLALYRDASQRLYVLKGEEKIFLRFADNPHVPPWFNNTWYGIENGWNYYAAEKVDDYYYLILRERTDRVDQSNAYYFDHTGKKGFEQTGIERSDLILFQLAAFSLDGIFLSHITPPVEPISSNPVFWTNVKEHADELINSTVRYYSPLENWAISNESILEEYLDGFEGRGPNDNPNGKLEDWAYQKYVALYPGEQVPATYGIEGNYPSDKQSNEASENDTNNEDQ